MERAIIEPLSHMIDSIRHEEIRENSKTVPHPTKMTVRATIHLSTARAEAAIRVKTLRIVSKTVHQRIGTASVETVTLTSLRMKTT